MGIPHGCLFDFSDEMWLCAICFLDVPLATVPVVRVVDSVIPPLFAHGSVFAVWPRYLFDLLAMISLVPVSC